jgi:hypothetical protein
MINLLICSLPILPVGSAELGLSFAIFLHPLNKSLLGLRAQKVDGWLRISQ